MMLSNQIKNQISAYKLENYAKANYNYHKKGFFGKMNLEEMLAWTDVCNVILIVHDSH